MDEEEYVADIVQLKRDFTLKSKDEGWRPDKTIKTSLEKIGYKFGATIGDGLFSKVKRAYCKRLNRDVAIKIIPKKKLSQEIHDKFLPREICLLQRLRHPSLVVLHEVYDTSSTLYMVMEYVKHGDLLDYVNRVGSLIEVDTRRIIHQLLDVVSFLHENCVFHRDIKLDNILLDEHYNIRLTDLGFARYNPKNDLMSTFCGSYAYVAPEILNGDDYEGAPADIWSVGVCMYAMLNGKLPFRDDDIDILRYSQLEKLKFYKYVCKAGRDLIREILNVLPNRRITIASIRRCLWMIKPMKNHAESMSSLSATSVTSSFIFDPNFDPSAEHGFSCAQHSEPPKAMKVSNILRSVAINHSSGSSSINLKQVVPTRKASPIAMVTGVSGPAGRRLSTALGISPVNVQPAASFKKSSGDAQPTDAGKEAGGGLKMFGKGAGGKGGGKAAFGRAMKAMNRFKVLAKAITAVKRFDRRGPLTTILKIPQAQAMEKLIVKRHQNQRNEMKDLHLSSSCKVAALVGNEYKDEQIARHRSSDMIESAQKMRKERKEMWDSTVTFLASYDSD